MKIKLENGATASDLHEFILSLEQNGIYLKGMNVYLQFEDADGNSVDVLDTDGNSVEVLLRAQREYVDCRWSCKEPRVARVAFIPRFRDGEVDWRKK